MKTIKRLLRPFNDENSAQDRLLKTRQLREQPPANHGIHEIGRRLPFNTDRPAQHIISRLKLPLFDCPSRAAKLFGNLGITLMNIRKDLKH